MPTDWTGIFDFNLQRETVTQRFIYTDRYTTPKFRATKNLDIQNTNLRYIYYSLVVDACLILTLFELHIELRFPVLTDINNNRISTTNAFKSMRKNGDEAESFSNIDVMKPFIKEICSGHFKKSEQSTVDTEEVEEIEETELAVNLLLEAEESKKVALMISCIEALLLEEEQGGLSIEDLLEQYSTNRKSNNNSKPKFLREMLLEVMI